MHGEMTSRERLWAALSGQQPDRVPIWMLYPREQLPYYVDVYSLPGYACITPRVWEQTDWFDRRGIPTPPFYTAAARIESRVERRGGWTITRRVLHTPRGDLFSEHQRVITTVVDGKVSLVDLALAPMKAPMFFKKSTIETQTDTGIRGKLVDSVGKPVPGSFALAYSDPDIKRLPDYASTLSDGNGNFVIYLPQGGIYFLGARIHAWDMPRPGELYGKFGDPEPTPVAVADGAFVEGVEIILTPFTGTYKEGKSRRPY